LIAFLSSFLYHFAFNLDFKEQTMTRFGTPITFHNPTMFQRMVGYADSAISWNQEKAHVHQINGRNVDVIILESKWPPRWMAAKTVALLATAYFSAKKALIIASVLLAAKLIVRLALRTNVLESALTQAKQDFFGLVNIDNITQAVFDTIAGDRQIIVRPARLMQDINPDRALFNQLVAEVEYLRDDLQPFDPNRCQTELEIDRENLAFRLLPRALSRHHGRHTIVVPRELQPDPNERTCVKPDTYASDAYQSKEISGCEDIYENGTRIIFYSDEQWAREPSKPVFQGKVIFVKDKYMGPFQEGTTDENLGADGLPKGPPIRGIISHADMVTEARIGLINFVSLDLIEGLHLIQQADGSWLSRTAPVLNQWCTMGTNQVIGLLQASQEGPANPT
jgi:hypothetical protein